MFDYPVRSPASETAVMRILTVLCVPRMPSLSSPPEPVWTAKGLADLVGEAMASLDDDHQQARVSLDRVLSLLKANQDGPEEHGAPTAAKVTGLAEWQIRRIKTHVEHRLTTPLSLGDLARLSRLSRAHFSRAFKSSFGTTPHQYIVQRRIARAQQALLTSAEPLSQVALTCGFADQSHFSRVFRRQVGSSPLAWRRTHGVGGVIRRLSRADG